MKSTIPRTVAILGLAAVLGGLYGLKERTNAFWLQERLGYLTQYREAVENREERVLQWVRANNREEVLRQRTLAEKIADADYLPLSANVPDIDSAALIILGDTHTHMDRKLNLLLPELVRQGDRVFVEQPADRYQTLDLSVYDAQHWPQALQDEANGKSLEEQLGTMLQNIDTTMRNIQSLENKMRRIDWASPEQGNFLQFLVAEGTGVVVPIDAPSALRDAYLCDIIQYSVLKSAAFHLDRGTSTLHPFEQWMIYEDLAIAEGDANANHLGRGIAAYVKHMPNTDFNRERQERIIDNVLQEVGDLRNEERAVLVIGSTHIDRFAPTLLDALQEARIPYVAFAPDDKSVFKTPAAAQTANWNYTETLLESYVAVRIAAGGRPYRGTFEDMSNRFAETFAKQ